MGWFFAIGSGHIRRLAFGGCLGPAQDKGEPYIQKLIMAAFLVPSFHVPAMAESMSSALARAYQGNPDINQQRAGVRATDENLPQASAAWRPTVSATGSSGYSYLDTAQSLVPRAKYSTVVGSLGLTVNQTLFNGNQTVNGVRRAESQIFGSRENLRNTEQSVLQNGATAYMDVLRDTAVLDLRKNNIIVLEEQLRQTRDRFNVGEVTRTDVAQAESSLATARSDYFVAQANLQTSIANYRQIIGVEPTRLEPARTIEKLLPNSVGKAINLALLEHPVIQAALHAADAAELQVKVAEGQLYPTVGIVGNVQQNYNFQGVTGSRSFNGTVLGQVSVPLYEGGVTYSEIRQAKETASQARLQADLQSAAVRALVSSTWGQLDSAKAVIQSSEAAVKSAAIALAGVREEAKVGQRTTLDVLNAQQLLLNTRVSLVSAQHDRVVASYAVMAAIGRLSAANLNLNVIEYDPTVHFDQVKNKWIGTHTPDGR